MFPMNIWSNCRLRFRRIYSIRRLAGWCCFIRRFIRNLYYCCFSNVVNVDFERPSYCDNIYTRHKIWFFSCHAFIQSTLRQNISNSDLLFVRIYFHRINYVEFSTHDYHFIVRNCDLCTSAWDFAVDQTALQTLPVCNSHLMQQFIFMRREWNEEYDAQYHFFPLAKVH